MAYQVFARKYRPQTFPELVGQEPVVRTLTNALRLGRIAQAYLFVGPRGTGKTSTARILAKALESASGPRADFDPAEPICQEIAEGRCLDVLEIDGASNNGVEQVRDLRDNVRYLPAKGRFKIYIVDEVHMLSTAAFNALLKTLEEPPAHIKFIFATTEVHKLPATILSRCQRFDLRRIPEPLIRTHLAHICDLEKVAAEPGALDAVARYAEGGLRDAESALDQAISFYGDRVSEADVLSLFGLTGFGPVAQLGQAVAQGDVATVLRLARTLSAAGKDLAKLSQDLLGFFRNLVIYQVSPAALDEELSSAEKAALEPVSRQISRGAALNILEELSHLESRLRYALAKDVVFEVALIHMSQLRERVSLETILETLGGGASPLAPDLSLNQAEPTPAASSHPPAARLPEPNGALPVRSTKSLELLESPEPVYSNPLKIDPPRPVDPPFAAPALGPRPVNRERVEAAWAAAVERFARERPLEADTINSLEFHAVKGDQIEIVLPLALEKKIHYLRSPRNLEILESVLLGELGAPLRLVFIIGSNPGASTTLAPNPNVNAAPPKPAPPPSLSQEAFLHDPAIQDALRIFEAKVVATK